MAEKHNVLTWLLALATVAYTTLGTYLVGLTWNAASSQIKTDGDRVEVVPASTWER